MKYNKNYYKNLIRDKFGDSLATRKFIAVINVAIDDKERISTDEFIKRFSFILS